MTRNKKKFLIILVAVLLVTVLTCGFYFSEAQGVTDPDAPYSPLRAIWYALVTLTTVGYGDVLPTTLGGYFFGGCLVICSFGVLSLIITLLLSWLNKGLPLLGLKSAAGKDWNIFIGDSKEADSLYENLLLTTGKETVFIFLKEGPDFDIVASSESDSLIFHVSMSLDRLLKYRKSVDRVNVFCFGEDLWNNYTVAAENAKAYPSIHFYALTPVKESYYASNLFLFNLHDEIARNYWDTYPVQSSEEKIILCGFGALGEAILNQALLTNILSVSQHISYYCVGNLEDYADFHYRLFSGRETTAGKSTFTCTLKNGPADTVISYDSLWKIPAETINTADRIILCMGQGKDNMALVQKLLNGYASTAHIHLFSPKLPSDSGITTFGSYASILSEKAVLKQERTELARQLHEIYRKSAGPQAAAWEQLTEFLKESNIASADHIKNKCRILLGQEEFSRLEAESPAVMVQKAVQAYDLAIKDPAKQELFRKIEHDRWLRFHMLNNWDYAPVRDNSKHLHPLCVPFDQLQLSDQVKDDYSWEILKEL